MYQHYVYALSHPQHSCPFVESNADSNIPISEIIIFNQFKSYTFFRFINLSSWTTLSLYFLAYINQS